MTKVRRECMFEPSPDLGTLSFTVEEPGIGMLTTPWTPLATRGPWDVGLI
jgi:hypothetical protein